jgi:hypothetical protein
VLLICEGKVYGLDFRTECVWLRYVWLMQRLIRNFYTSRMQLCVLVLLHMVHACAPHACAAPALATPWSLCSLLRFASLPFFFRAPPPAVSQAHLCISQMADAKFVKRQSVVCRPVVLYNNLSAIDHVRPPLAHVHLALHAAGYCDLDGLVQVPRL